ncbi:MAG: plasmid replication protein, CyRepA1 family [Waterburya sp.]
MTNFDHSQNNQNETSPFDHIASHHLAEWRESSVDDQLTALNLLSLKGTEPLEYLFCDLPNSCRRNDGRVRDYLLARYAHTEAGGQWIPSLDPHNNWQEWDWGRFKPDEPRVDSKGKIIKYESPPKSKSHVTYFRVPQHIWDKVAKRYRIKRYRSRLTLRLADKLKPKSSHSPVENKHTAKTSKTEAKNRTQQQKRKSTSISYSLTATGEKQSLSDCLRHGIKPIVPFLPLNLQSEPDLEELLYCFWEWVKDHPEIPIILTEGEKKAACLLSLGFVAIALPGIWMGRVRDKETGLDYLHPDLMPMVHPKRKFVILFDNDPKPSTQEAVRKATLYTGKVIEAAGAKCEVASLPSGSEKGVDDYVTANGKKAKSLILKILKTALAFKDFVRRSRRRKWVLSDKYPPNIVVNTRYLGDAVQNLPDSGLVVLWSEMGTGKTELLRRFRSSHPEERFLNIGHRVNLMQNLSPRLQTILYSEIAQGNLANESALSITLDSLYKLETQLNKYGCVFIDEACQNLAHLLHSKTCKEHRAEILDKLEYIVRSAKLVVIADAHMNDTTVDFFRSLRSVEETPFIIKNEYKNAGREVHLYEGDNSSALVAKISSALMLGLKIMVVSDSKKFIKKLEALMNVQIMEEHSLFGNDESETSNSKKLRVWSIHADNSGSEENKVFIKDISNQVKNVDMLAASPSLGTGVDIKDYHFDVVFGAFHAVSQSATECVQALHRYRPLVPLHIWVAPRPPFDYKETRPWKIKERIFELNQLTAFLIRIDQETGKRGAEKDWALDAYCQIEAQRNESINNLRDDMITLLEDMAYKINTVEVESDAVVKTMLSEAGKYLDATHRLAVTNAATISSTEYLARQTKEYLSPEEVVECEKYRIERDYGMPVTEELVKLDADGLLISRLILLESLIAPSSGEVIDPITGRKTPAPPKIVAEKDLRERENLPLSMDWHNYSSKWLAYHCLGFPKILMRLLAGEEITASDPDVMRMNQNAFNSRAHVKSILNLTVRSDCLEKPLWLMGKFLERVGLKTALRKKGRRGEQVTYRSLDTLSLSFAIEVLQYRSEQRIEKAKKERERQEKSAQHQAYMQSMYGIEPPESSSVSTSPHKRDVYKLEGDMDTKENPSEIGETEEDDTLKNLQPCLNLFEGIVDSGVDVLKTVLKELLRSRGLSKLLLKGLSKYVMFLPMGMNEG